MPSFRKIGIFVDPGKSGARFYKITKGTLQASKVPKASKPTVGAASSPDTCRTDSESWTDKRPEWADSDSMYPPANPATARDWADRTLRTDKTEHSILCDDTERF
ncbi:hypothetical protein [Methyloglobulus sp.]|uniref:hypothetical protein n=1 Tax=Methyloglobulus sp. TaxID=2518622 RepID=UPI00398A28CB